MVVAITFIQGTGNFYGFKNVGFKSVLKFESRVHGCNQQTYF